MVAQCLVCGMQKQCWWLAFGWQIGRAARKCSCVATHLIVAGGAPGGGGIDAPPRSACAGAQVPVWPAVHSKHAPGGRRAGVRAGVRCLLLSFVVVASQPVRWCAGCRRCMMTSQRDGICLSAMACVPWPQLAAQHAPSVYPQLPPSTRPVYSTTGFSVFASPPLPPAGHPASRHSKIAGSS